MRSTDAELRPRKMSRLSPGPDGSVSEIDHGRNAATASVAMADFISNSAILTTIRPRRRAYGRSLDRPKARKMADFTGKSDIMMICTSLFHHDPVRRIVTIVRTDGDGIPSAPTQPHSPFPDNDAVEPQKLRIT